MKTISFFLLTFFTCLGIKAQDDFDTRWNAAFELASADQYDEALAAFEPLLVEQPSYAETQVQMAWCYMLKGEMEEAGERAQTAFQLDQLSPSVFAINAYLLSAAGMGDASKVFLNDAIWFSPNDEDLKYYESDIAKMKEAGLNVASLEEELKKIMASLESRNKQWTAIQDKFFEAVGVINAGNSEFAKIIFKEEMFPMFETVPEQQQRFAFIISYIVGTYYYNVGDSANYLPLLTRTYDHLKKSSKTSYNILLHMNTLLGEHYYNVGQYEKSFEILSEGLDHFTFINAYRFLGGNKAQFLTQYTASALAVGNLAEARDGGNLVTELTYTGFDEWYTVNALTYIAQSWQEEDAIKAKAYYQQAYDLANESGFEDLKTSIAENLK